MADTDTIEKEFEGLTKKLKGAIETIEKKHDEIIGEMKSRGEATVETKATADKAIIELNSISTRLTEIEQKMVRKPGPGVPERKSIGEMFVEDPKVKEFLATNSKRGAVSVSLETKNITSGTGTVGSTASVGTSLVVPDRQSMVPLPMRTLVVRDLLTPGQTSSNNIEYPVMVTRTQNAAPVAEGATKPQSDLTFDLRPAPVRTIAHWFKASRQIMDDAPGLQSMIDGEARYGLAFLEDTEFLYGDGTGAHLNGIIPQASAYSAPFAPTGETAIDRLRLAILQASLALYPATGMTLHPTDWAKIEMTKDGMGRYIVGNPVGQIAPTLWGLPVASTMAQTVGTFLVGAFRRGAQIFDRMSVEVLLSTEDQDNFVKNMITIRAEQRLALAVYRPTAFITGNLP